MSNLNKIISVIIPVYNVENYIEKCLNSIVNQTYNNLEILIIDDGSTDNSIAIVYMAFNVICLEFGVQKSLVDRLFKK